MNNIVVLLDYLKYKKISMFDILEKKNSFKKSNVMLHQNTFPLFLSMETFLVKFIFFTFSYVSLSPFLQLLSVLSPSVELLLSLPLGHLLQFLSVRCAA